MNPLVPTDIQAAMSDEALRLLDFGAQSRTEHGFGWLSDEGTVDDAQGVQLWITGRMTHCFSLAALMGLSQYAPLATHGIAALRSGALRAESDGGWYSRVEMDGSVAPGLRTSYDHAFVVLAASSARLAGVEQADELLREAIESFERLWWDEAAGMVVDARDPQTLEVDPYRGVNANMHWVEALLGAWGATGEREHLERASRIAARVASMFTDHAFRLPEHFNEAWEPLLDYNRDIPADKFRPFGSTPGHWLEWARLFAQLAYACDEAGVARDERLDAIPPFMYRLALLEGWGVDGQPGFVYTTDFEGHPVVAQRMHWVLCEAIATAQTLKLMTGDASYGHDVALFWEYARRYLIEAPGQWRHELDALNAPAQGTWAGKPDIYHAFQTMIIGTLPLSASFAAGLAQLR